MEWIDDVVAVGGWLDGASARRHRLQGIDLIIDARTLFTQSILASRRSPLVDRLLLARDRLVDISVKGPKVLVFCNRGKDRSPFVAMLYMSKRYGISHREAYEMVKTKNELTAFHWNWVEAVERGEAH
jgi:hypothetical protein